MASINDSSCSSDYHAFSDGLKAQLGDVCRCGEQRLTEKREIGNVWALEKA